MCNGLVNQLFFGGAAVTVFSLVGCGGMNPTQLFAPPSLADAMTQGGPDQSTAAQAEDGGAIVMTMETRSGTEPDAAVTPVDASAEGAAPPSGDDADVDAPSRVGEWAPADAGAEGSSADLAPPDGAALPDATDVCLNPPAGANAAVAATFEADDTRVSRWSSFGGCSFEVTSARAHCGTHSGRCTGRVAPFQGPGYDLVPTAGTYTLSAWVLQNGSTPTSLLWNVKLVCLTNGVTTTVYPPASLPVSAAPKTWVLTAGTFVVPSGCSTVQIYLNQLDSAPMSLPTLFADDVYVY